MVPLVGNHKELRYQKGIIDHGRRGLLGAQRQDRLHGRHDDRSSACRSHGHQIAEVAEFFSFGTNDLTQMTLGFSRDDIGKFLPVYLEKGILKNDPFQILDRNGVRNLVISAR